MKRIYLDNNATTQILPEVLEEMLPFLGENFGNPSSIHDFGQKARVAVDRARIRLAESIGARPDEIIFTSSGTEADNLAVTGYITELIYSCGKEKPHLISSPIEHKAVYETCKILADRNLIELTLVPVDLSGAINPDDIKNAIRKNTKLISVMWANNETGIIQPINEIAALLSGTSIAFHTDAVQAFGKTAINVRKAGIDMLSVSGHKIHAAKGIGALYLRRGLKISPLIFGGSHEKSLRAGTENVPGIVSLGKAASVLTEKLEATVKHEENLRKKLIKGIRENISEISFNGSLENSIPNTLNVSFKGLEAEALLARLDMAGIAVSTGSACSSGANEPSRVLKAMGVHPDYAYSALRFSMSHSNTEEEIAETIRVLSKIVSEMRKS